MSLDITKRKQMEEALRLSHQRLDLLAESASRLLASEAPQKMVDIICPKVMEFLDCDVFFNFLLDEQEGRLHLNAWAGIQAEEAKRIEWLDYGVAVCGCAARDGCRIVAEDIQTTSDGRTELVKSYGIQAYACHPLVVQGRTLGTLSFGTRRRNRFSKDELALMQAVADQVAVAMDRKRFLEALRQARDELEKRVGERTKELQFTVTQLQEEVRERLRTEAELSQQSKLVYDLYNQAPCGYHSLDAEGKFVQINDTELAWLGYTREELLGKIKFSDLLTSQGRKFFQQSFLNFKERGWVKDLEYDLIRKDGTHLPVLLSATAVTDEAGHFLMSRGTVYDLTDRVRAGAALARERQRLFQVLEQLPAYVALLAPDYTVQYANREFIRRFGAAEEGQRCYEYLFGRDKPCEDCNTFKVLETNACQEWEWLGPDGRTYGVFDYPFTDEATSPPIDSEPLPKNLSIVNLTIAKWSFLPIDVLSH
jgi:PAS domain S-box-containing protein